MARQSGFMTPTFILCEGCELHYLSLGYDDIQILDND